MNKVSIFAIFNEKELIYISSTRNLKQRVENIKKNGIIELPEINFNDKSLTFTVLEIIDEKLVKDRIEYYKEKYSKEEFTEDVSILVIDKETEKLLGSYSSIEEIENIYKLSKTMIKSVLDGRYKSQKGLIIKYNK